MTYWPDGSIVGFVSLIIMRRQVEALLEKRWCDFGGGAVTRDRLRTWIGEHPIVAVTVVGYAVTFAAALTALIMVHHGLRPIRFFANGGLLVCLVLNGGWAFYVGCLRGRAGLKAASVVIGVFPVMLPAILLWCILYFERDTWIWLATTTSWFMPVTMLCLSASQLSAGAIGMGGCVAGMITDYMIRRGKWEKVVPVGKKEQRAEESKQKANT